MGAHVKNQASKNWPTQSTESETILKTYLKTYERGFVSEKNKPKTRAVLVTTEFRGVFFGYAENTRAKYSLQNFQKRYCGIEKGHRRG